MRFKYKSTKTYNHDRGLSTAFRQWKAKESHCSFLHGYAFAIKLVFGSNELDIRNWVVDFGGLKPLYKEFEGLFDHKTIVSADDPEYEWFMEAHRRKILDLVVLDMVGCEMFAKEVYKRTEGWLDRSGYGNRVKLISAEVMEHGANSGIYEGLDA